MHVFGLLWKPMRAREDSTQKAMAGCWLPCSFELAALSTSPLIFLTVRIYFFTFCL
ncbi:hypothetical protein EXN66_Car001271 [Channa argus]|uniref:Uncharacterized protein n=1 Tax=Channa argus TaxID=215402 RepID=A0A6G1R0V9_CHAAH|nr:hypothetical protein EXN66_Car001271 [Channa argus]